MYFNQVTNFLKDFIYLFFRDIRRKREIEVCLSYAPNQEKTFNPGMWPDLESDR